MGKELGQSVIVENTVGAGGTIAATRVARSAPDGYMIFIHHMGMATAPALYKKLPFDPMKDFEYIGQVVDVPMTLLARKDFPANNYTELLATNSRRAIEKAVKGMMPHNKLSNAQISKLKVYAGDNHPHAAQNPQPFDITQVAH